MSTVAVAVVVGGGSGIGAAVASHHRARGHEVIVWDLSEGSDVICDVTDAGQVERAAATTIEQVGPPDYVTITAGVGHAGPLLDVDPAEWDRIMDINTKGSWLAMRALARPMLEGRGGSIVATSSVSARLADRNMGTYCISKAGLDMLIRVAAREWAPSVRVNGVAPGVTDTAMLGPVPRDRGWLPAVVERTALGRLGTPGDVAEAVAALHGMRWVTGQTIVCDGGLSLHSPIDPTGRA